MARMQLKTRRTTATLAMATACAASVPAWASPRLEVPLQYAYGESDTPRSAGMGGALLALGNGGTGVFLNPATLGETRIYHLEGIGQVTPEAGRQVYGGLIVDSITGNLAGGVSLTGGWLKGKDSAVDRSMMDTRLALALPLGDAVLVGLAGHWSKVSQAGLEGPLGDSRVSGGLAKTPGDRRLREAMVDGASLDAGLVIRSNAGFHVGALGKNLTVLGEGLLPTLLGAGLGWGNRDVSIECDGLADLDSYDRTTVRVMGGGEVLLADRYPIRGGYRFDQGADVHTVSAGVGYLSPEFGVEASVQRGLSAPGLTTVVFGMAYYLESSGLTREPEPRDLPGLGSDGF